MRSLSMLGVSVLLVLVSGCKEEVAPTLASVKPARLFPHTPDWARNLMPMGQADLAYEIAQVSTMPIHASSDAKWHDAWLPVLSNSIGPEWRVDGWVFQVQATYHGLSPQQVICLEFPQELSGHDVHLEITSSDFEDREKYRGVSELSALKVGDWIRFSVSTKPETKPEWVDGKGIGSVFIHPLILTKIERFSPPVPNTPGN